MPREVKQARLTLLQHRLIQHEQAIGRRMVGGLERILVERPSKKYSTQLAGRTENNRVVNFTGPADLIGELVELRITEVLPNSLRGELIRPVAQSA